MTPSFMRFVKLCFHPNGGALANAELEIVSLRASLDDARAEIGRLSVEKQRRDTVIHNAQRELESLHAPGEHP
jgi:hypothetical protein